jgi:hypothetical protein
MAATVPESFPALAKRLQAVVHDSTVEAASQRWELAQALRVDRTTAESCALLRPLARALCADVAGGAVIVRGPDLEAIVNATQDASLRADLPAMPAAASPHQGFFSLTVETADAGNTPIFDAHWLPGGRLLVALGEAGCRLLDASGHTLAQFAQPAETLVISTHGSQALAVARRGEMCRVGRLDLVARTESAWCVTRIDTFATSYDGAQWFVGIEGTLHALDATSAAAESIWSVDPGSPVAVIQHEHNALRVQDARPHCWHYELPNLTLRNRSDGELAPPPYRIEDCRVSLENASAAFHMQGATRLRARVRGQHLTVSDNRGRLLVFDLALRRLLHNRRL